jgi:hypothetical protein
MIDANPSIYTPEFFAAWETFLSRLEFGFETEDPSLAELPRTEQQGRYVLANLALADFFKTLGDSKTADKFHFLAEAFQNLTNGIVHPLFKVEKPSGKAGRPQDPSAVWRVRADVVLALQNIIAAGLDIDEAVKIAVKKHSKELSSLQRPNTDLSSSLRTWLKSFATDVVGDDVALDAYKFGMHLLEGNKSQCPGEQLKLLGENLLAGAAERASTV